MQSINKIHVNSSTRLSLNDRFTIIKKVGSSSSSSSGGGSARPISGGARPISGGARPISGSRHIGGNIGHPIPQRGRPIQRSRSRSRSRSRGGPPPFIDPINSLRNRSLLAQLDHRHKLRTALKIKRKRLNARTPAIDRRDRLLKRRSNVAINTIGRQQQAPVRRRLNRNNSLAQRITANKLDLVQNGRRRGRSRSRSRANLTKTMADRLGVRGQQRPQQQQQQQQPLQRSRSRSRQRLNSIGNNNHIGQSASNLLRRRTNSTTNVQQRQRPRLLANSQIRQRPRANSQQRFIGVRRRRGGGVASGNNTIRGGGPGANNTIRPRRIARRNELPGGRARKPANGNRNGVQNGRVFKRRQIGGGARNGGQKVSQQQRGRSRSRVRQANGNVGGANGGRSRSRSRNGRAGAAAGQQKQQNRGRSRSRGRARPTGNNGKSRQQLDKELDQYMAKPRSNDFDSLMN